MFEIEEDNVVYYVKIYFHIFDIFYYCGIIPNHEGFMM